MLANQNDAVVVGVWAIEAWNENSTIIAVHDCKEPTPRFKIEASGLNVGSDIFPEPGYEIFYEIIDLKS